MKVIKYLGNLGYGSRREVEHLVTRRHVTRRDGSVVREGEPFEHDDLLVDGRPLDPPPGTLLMLHKPVGYVCSTRDASRLIYELLPPRFLNRSPVMAPVGRLDRDTSGLLLVTDDGQLNHRLTSPRKHVTKVYDVMLATDLGGDEGSVFAAGTLMLDSETTPLLPAKLEVLGPRLVRVTLHEGRYHQVRRMFAAMGNRVDALHRRAIGALELGELASGAYRIVSPVEVGALLGQTHTEER